MINRQDAINTLAEMHCKSDEDGYVWIIRSDAWARIDALPSVEPTLYGYEIEHLALIATVMRKNGVTAEKAVEAFENIVEVVQMIMNEQKDIIRKAVEQWEI